MATAKASALSTRGPTRLFLSYAREDHARVEPLANALGKAGFRVWWDAALEGGHHFAAEIERELEAADAVLVVWSAASIQSNWVLDEAMHGRDRGCLIPVRFDDSVPPLGFRQIQTIDLDEGLDETDLRAIGRAVGRIKGETTAEPGGASRRSGKSVRKAPTNEKKPVWVPFAWAVFGVAVWLISSAIY